MKNKYNLIIGILSAIIVFVVALTIFLPPVKVKQAEYLDSLPLYNALFNGLSFASLILAYFFIKNGNVKGHVRMIFTAILFTLLFLVSYLLYHFTHKPTLFGGQGALKVFYLILLATHIILAVVMLPLILLTIKEALSKNYNRHKKIARWTLPIWLYVSFTGVLVYLLNSPYY